MCELASDELTHISRLQRRNHDRLIGKMLKQQTPHYSKTPATRLLGQPAHAAHVFIEVAQFFVDWIEHGRRFADDGMVAKNAQQMTTGSAQVTIVPVDRPRAVAAWEVVVEKAADSDLVKLLERTAALTHPPSKMCDT